MNPESSRAGLEQWLGESREALVRSPEWYQQLKDRVTYLIQQDFDGLLQLLYRVDVSEVKLRRALQQLPGGDAAEIIANLLLERQLQKIKSRRDFSPPDDTIPEDERW